MSTVRAKYIKPFMVPLGVNLNVPYAEHLVGLYVFNEFDPTTVRDLVSGRTVSIFTPLFGPQIGPRPPINPKMIFGQAGTAYSQDAGGDGYYVPMDDSNGQASTEQFSILGVIRSKVTGMGGPVDYFIGGASIVTSPGSEFGIPTNVLALSQYADTYFSYNPQYNGSGLMLRTSVPINGDEHVVIGITRSQTQHEIWLDGGISTSYVADVGTPVTREYFSFGGIPVKGGQGAPIEISLLAMWNIALPPEIATTFSSNPYQIVEWGIPNSIEPEVTWIMRPPIPVSVDQQSSYEATGIVTQDEDWLLEITTEIDHDEYLMADYFGWQNSETISFVDYLGYFEMDFTTEYEVMWGVTQDYTTELDIGGSPLMDMPLALDTFGHAAAEQNIPIDYIMGNFVNRSEPISFESQGGNGRLILTVPYCPPLKLKDLWVPQEDEEITVWIPQPDNPTFWQDP